ncbi:unnamed protein product [Peniophora sp. CBMAI 1063]|nr:unnamed protein product [Peniophora sp. CBMAI 1063]
MSPRGDSKKKLALIKALNKAPLPEPHNSVPAPWPGLPPVPRFIDAQVQHAPWFSKEYFEVFKKDGAFTPRTNNFTIYLMFEGKNLEGKGRNLVQSEGGGGWKGLLDNAKRADGRAAQEKLLWINFVADEQKRSFDVYYPDYKKPSVPRKDKPAKSSSSTTASGSSSTSSSPPAHQPHSINVAHGTTFASASTFTFPSATFNTSYTHAQFETSGLTSYGNTGSAFEHTLMQQPSINYLHMEHPHANPVEQPHAIESFTPAMHLLTALDIALNDMGKSAAAGYLLDLSEDVRNGGMTDDDALETFFDVLMEIPLNVTELHSRVLDDLRNVPHLESFVRGFFDRVYYAIDVAETHNMVDAVNNVQSNKRAFEYGDDDFYGEVPLKRTRQ